MSSIQSLPLFPLPDVVLLPEISVPLRIFEPRYCQMMNDALAGLQQIGMIAIRPDDLCHLSGDPKIFHIGCLGRIAHSQKQPDGTFDLLLEGEARFRILQEEPRGDERLYRSARVELLVDELSSTPETQARLETKRTELLSLLERLVHRINPHDTTHGTAHQTGPGTNLRAANSFEKFPAARLINSLTQSISLRPIERQQLLEANTILSRFETMCDLLRFRLAEGGGSGFQSSPLPN